MLQSTAFDKIKTLIAEDDKSVSLIYRIGLKEEVFDNRFLVNGNDVLEVYQEWKPDILILDIMLPGTSGYAILKVIREKMESTHTAIIMASSLSDRSAVLDCLELGVQGYIVKPFNHQEISHRVLSYYQKTNPEKAAAALALLDAVKAAAIQADTTADTTGKPGQIET
jgi:DNA-binding response OmpR family regulator